MPAPTTLPTVPKGYWLAIAMGTIMLTLALTALSVPLMNKEALQAAEQQNRLSLPVMIHLATIIPALPLGLYLLLAAKGTAVHKLLGKIWCGLLLITAVAALFIHSFGGFSPIHFFSLLTFWGVFSIIRYARKGDIDAHQRAVKGLFIGMCVAGLFAFIPGRLMAVWLGL
jgi:uncharacterized membrane protein